MKISPRTRETFSDEARVLLERRAERLREKAKDSADDEAVL